MNWRRLQKQTNSKALRALAPPSREKSSKGSRLEGTRRELAMFIARLCCSKQLKKTHCAHVLSLLDPNGPATGRASPDDGACHANPWTAPRDRMARQA